MKLDETLKVEDFLFDEMKLVEFCPVQEDTARPPAKKTKSDVEWKSIHEEFCTQFQLPWPPPVQELSHVNQFRAREAEVVWFANRIWPVTADQVGTWMFFDSNLTLGRAFRWPPKNGLEQEPHNPWRLQVPTMSGETVTCARHLSECGKLIVRRLHGLEAMALQGWTLGCWRDGKSPLAGSSPPGKSCDFLCDMAGNMWSCFHFLPICLASFGAVDWAEACAKQKEALEARARQRNRSTSVDTEDDSSYSD